MTAYLGVDGGGTRSSALVADETGTILGRAEGGPANYQSIGGDAARGAIADVALRALGAAGTTFDALARAAYGIAGADRPKDFEAIQLLLPAEPPRSRRTLVNDSQLVLRAGTSDGVGVAVVSGTGTNAIGRSAEGEIRNVGGYCFELGDFGSAGDIGREAMRRAMRGQDGRGEPTALYGAFCTALGVDPLEDVIDLWMREDPKAIDSGRLAPLVFDAAAGGDRVARTVLEEAGRELALAALVLLDVLFRAEESVTVVLGGSVLQRGTDPTLVRTLAGALAGGRTGVRVVRLEVEPVVGALLLARDGDEPGDGTFATGLRGALGQDFVTDIAV